MEDMLTMHVLPHKDTLFHGEDKEKEHCQGEAYQIMACQLAQAYVRKQPLCGLYAPEEGLRRGTAFPNLCQPYEGWQKRPLC